MASITLLERDLITRQNELHAIFTPLRERGRRVAFRFANDSPGRAKALVATDQRAGILRYRDAMFQTSVKILRSSTLNCGGKRRPEKLILDRAYFTLLRVDQVRNGLP